jgi:hypothetical protein
MLDIRDFRVGSSLNKFRRAQGFQKGVERIEQLFAKAAEVGIDQQQAWSIIAEGDDDNDPKAGLRVLIAAIEQRMCGA